MCTPRHARHGHDDARARHGRDDARDNRTRRHHDRGDDDGDHARDHRVLLVDDALDLGHVSSNHHLRLDGDDDAHAPLLHEAS